MLETSPTPLKHHSERPIARFSRRGAPRSSDGVLFYTKPESTDDPRTDSHAVLARLLGRVAEDRDEAAFSELYDRVSGAIFALILTIVRENAAAEDVLQETFSIVWRRAMQYDSSVGKALSWMMQIARHKAFDHLARCRKQDRVRTSISEEENRAGDGQAVPDTVNPIDAVASREESRAVRSALEKLPPTHAEAIRLAFFQGKTQTEIADDLGLPLGTIKARIRRGLLQMRHALPRDLTDFSHC